jgi:dipeptidyl aminopeptidase/acylaminoacyl peptidase
MEREMRGRQVDQARLLADRLSTNGTPVRLRIYANTPHSIPIAAQWEEIDPFLKDVIGQ